MGVDKFNAAFSAGGPDKTLKVVQQLTGLDINHVVNINFTGFADAVDAIGGVYVDVDRRYYIAEDDPSDTSAIDIEAGYQLVQGFKALQYVRFRHFDNDLVRAARQQDFLREARQKLPRADDHQRPRRAAEDLHRLHDVRHRRRRAVAGAAEDVREASSRRPCARFTSRRRSARPT